MQPLVAQRSVPQASKPRPARPRRLAWTYALRVPSWSTAELPDGDTCVFYQVGAHSKRRAPLIGSRIPFRALLLVCE